MLKGPQDNPFRERALYMQGWSIFKQGRLEDALGSFFGVLDSKIAGIEDDDLEESKALTRADKELVDDTLRVASISLANLKGEESIPPYMTTDARHSYEFRVYQNLAALYLKQDPAQGRGRHRRRLRRACTRSTRRRRRCRRR